MGNGVTRRGDTPEAPGGTDETGEASDMPTPHPVRHRDGTVAWRVRFRLDGGNPVSETFNDRAAAARFARLVEQVGGAAARQARDMTGAADASTPTLAAAVDQHLAELAASVTPGTIRRYRQIADSRILPALGATPVDLITRSAVTRWLAEQRTTPVTRGSTRGRPPSAKTLRGAQALLSAVLERQVEAGTIPRNVARGLKIPRDTVSRERVFLTPGQFAGLLEHVPAEHRALVAALYGLGLRFGEATALTPADLDLDADQPVVRITRAWKEDRRGSYLGAPKTRRAVRTVTIPPSLVPVLREQAHGRARSALLFSAAGGGQITSGAFHAHVWRPAVQAAGLDPRPRVHDLRHSHASALIAAGIPLPVIQRRLGHESIQTTVDTYGHLAPEAYAGAARAMDGAMVQALPQIEG